MNSMIEQSSAASNENTKQDCRHNIVTIIVTVLMFSPAVVADSSNPGLAFVLILAAGMVSMWIVMLTIYKFDDLAAQLRMITTHFADKK